MSFSDSTFLLHVKSTIDYLGVELAAELGYASFVDLDDKLDYVEKLQEGKDDAIVWRIADFDAEVACAVYRITFLIGSAIHADINNTKAIQTAGVINDKFTIGQTISVRDYTLGTEPATDAGFLSITRVNLDPAVSDGMSGYRFMAITGIVARAMS